MTGRIAFTLLALTLTLACNRAQKSPATSSSGTTPAATTQAPATSTQPAAATANSVGIAVCDEYLNKYEACINNKVPAVSRASFKQAMDQTRATWRQAASNPAAKQGLEMGCQQALAATKQAMASYNCQW
jgi:hypothetical protein